MLLPYKVMARPWLVATSKALGHFPPKEPLDREEMAGGETAIAAVLYQEGLQMNAWALLGMWGLGVGSYRLIKYLDQKQAESEKNAKTLTAGEMRAKLQAEREKLSSPPMAPVQANANGHVNGIAAPISQNEATGEKPAVSAQEVMSLINFPGDKH